MKKLLALLAVSALMVSSVDPAFAGWRRCCRQARGYGYGQNYQYNTGYAQNTVGGCCNNGCSAQTYNNGMQQPGQPVTAGYPPADGPVIQNPPANPETAPAPLPSQEAPRANP